MELAPVDFGIIAIFLISCLIAIWRGCLRETITIVGLVVASVVAYLFSKDAAVYVTFVENAELKQQIASSVLFSLVFFGLFFIKLILFKAFKISGVAPIDRLLGLGFGILRGVVIVVAIMLFMPKALSDKDWYKKSAFIPKFVWMEKAVDKAMPKGWNKFEKLDELSKQLDDGVSTMQKAKEAQDAAKNMEKADPGAGDPSGIPADLKKVLE